MIVEDKCCQMFEEEGHLKHLWSHIDCQAHEYVFSEIKYFIKSFNTNPCDAHYNDLHSNWSVKQTLFSLVMYNKFIDFC